MKTFAYIPKEDGVIHEVYKGEELFPMDEKHAAAWKEVTEEAKEGDLFDGEKVVPVDKKPDEKDEIKRQITVLEISKQTFRRMREAILTGDTKWLKDVEDEIAELRKNL